MGRVKTGQIQKNIRTNTKITRRTNLEASTVSLQGTWRWNAKTTWSVSLSECLFIKWNIICQKYFSMSWHLPSRTTHQQTGLAPPEKWRRVLTVKPTGWPTMEWRKILMEWQEVGDFWLGLVCHWAGGGCVTLSKSEAAEMGWRKPTGERWNRRRFRSWWI